MPLPFSLAGRVDVPEVSDVDLAASRLESALEALKPRRIQRTGAHLDFNGGSVHPATGHATEPAQHRWLRQAGGREGL